MDELHRVTDEAQRKLRESEAMVLAKVRTYRKKHCRVKYKIKIFASSSIPQNRITYIFVPCLLCFSCFLQDKIINDLRLQVPTSVDSAIVMATVTGHGGHMEADDYEARSGH